MKHEASQTQQHPRDARLPLFVHVVTQPLLGDCWSVNISRTGMGLEASSAAPEDPLIEGSRVELEFSLPDSGSRLRAVARVAWRDERWNERGVSLGVQFIEMEAEHRALLIRYLQEYRFRVALAPADARELARVAKALDGTATVFIASSEEHLDEILSRGDISVVVVLGDDEASATAQVERVLGGAAQRAGRAARAAMAPRFIYAGRGSPTHLVRLHNAGLVFQSLPHPPEAAVLRTAVLRGCEDFAVRTELRRVSHELERALLRERARARVGDPHHSVAASSMVAVSEPMRAAMSLLQTAAPEKVHVLLEGETGTGKELLARALHEMSDRANAPFVTQDCGALTETLLESELFGHVKGAFTGAMSDHPGLFLTAEGGTIFLDEIENTSPSLQAKLLRVIETGEVRPVGSTQRRCVDVRIVAASNRDLRAEVAFGRFRADLYYRLNIFPIQVAPLRARAADILPLARSFLERACSARGRAPRVFSSDAELALLRHSWPGNVRELRNVIERAVLLSREPVIGSELLLVGQDDRDRAASGARSLQAQLREAERAIIHEALKAHGGVLRRAARALKTDPVTLGRRARRHGLWPYRPKPGLENCRPAGSAE